jgi:hypothetical protein
LDAVGLLHTQTLLGGGGAWVVSGGEKPAPMAGRVREGAGLSIPAGPVVIGGDGGAWRLHRRETVRRGRGERERHHFYSAAAGWGKFRKISERIGCAVRE